MPNPGGVLELPANGSSQEADRAWAYEDRCGIARQLRIMSRTPP
jgi:hypothetical protein